MNGDTSSPRRIKEATMATDNGGEEESLEETRLAQNQDVQVDAPHESQTYPRGSPIKATAPLIACILALVSVGIGSWSCKYVEGQVPGTSDTSFGIWTLEDTTRKCQLWSALLYSYDLGPSVYVAQFCSSCSMALGLILLAVVIQTTQLHVVSWMVGFAFMVAFIVSLSTSNIFNLWVVFWGLTYIFVIQLVRYKFHPQPATGYHLLVSAAFVLNSIFAIMTLIMQVSKFCDCSGPGEEEGVPCLNQCRLGRDGYLMVAASVFWLSAGMSTLVSGLQEANNTEIRSTRRKPGKKFRATVVVVPVESCLAKVGTSGSRKQHDPARIRRKCSSVGSGPNDGDNESGHIRTLRLGRIYHLHRNTNESESSTRGGCIWLHRILWASFLTVYVMIIVLLIGSKVENIRAARVADTSSNFVTDVVCAFNPLNTVEPFVEFPTKREAHEMGYVVAHCGACAFCSNMEDIRTYVETRETIAESAKECGAVALLGKYDNLVHCLEDRIDFSPPCTVCWADNMKSTARNCLFTCMSALLTGFMKKKQC